MSRDAATVLQIVEAARLAREFVQSLDREAFARDARTRSAVLYQLLVIGEAAKRWQTAQADAPALLDVLEPLVPPEES